MPLNKILLGSVLAALTVAAPAVAADKHKYKQPNVLVILVDDLGWPDVSTYGRTTVPTPNIDRIAKAGTAFSHGYVTGSVCSVSRAGLLTGKMPADIGFDYQVNESDTNKGLPPDEKTIADRLKALGYHTGLIGKWHQGMEDQFYPTNRGFDEFWGFLGGETQYVDPKMPGMVTTRTSQDRPIGQRKAWGQILEGPDRTPVNNFDKYLTNDITDHAVSYIDRNSRQSSPFFLYLAYNAPHWPLQVPKVYYDKFSGIEDPVRRTYVAMIAALDDNVGRVLDELDKKGERDNTLIVFLSDNGCPIQFGFCDCGHPLGSGKFTYLEGGTRVPFMMSWPVRLKPHAVVDTPVSSLDILPTVLSAAGARKPVAGLPGRDLLKTIQNPQADADRTLMWGQEPVFAAVQSHWKLWQSRDQNRIALYDLDADPYELNDVSTQQTKVAQGMSRKLDAWRSRLPAPLWPLHSTHTGLVCGRQTQFVN
jgi:arylsulfatase A-like enzyme